MVRLLQCAAVALAALSATAHAHADDYALRKVGNYFRSDNRAQALSVTLREGAASFSTSRLEAGLELAGFGRAGHMQSVALRGVARRNGRVEHDRGAVREWFVNGHKGLQQGFDIAKRPKGTGPLVLEVAFRGVVPELRDDHRVALLDRGLERLSYDTLRAWDATGKELPAHMRVESGRVQLWVDDAGARYPLVIDPYVQLAELTPSNPVRYNLYGVSIAGEADTLAVGAMGDATHGTYAGAVHVLGWDGGAWVENVKVFPEDPSVESQFGNSVALSGDTLVVGAWKDSTVASSAGAVYVFVREGAQWRQQAKLRAPLPQASGQFGASVAISGDTLVTNEDGIVHVFTRTGEEWNETAQLTAPSGETNIGFGNADLSGAALIVGASGEHVGRVGTGAAYIYRRGANGTWTQEARLSPLPAQERRGFGSSVRIVGDRAMVGAKGENGAATGTGAVYVYERQGGTWQQRSRLTASDAATGHSFGKTVDFDGDVAVVGSSLTSATGARTGAAYVFARTSQGWVEQTKLLPSDPRDLDFMGNAVLALGRRVLVSSYMRRVGVVHYGGVVYSYYDRALELGEACRTGAECPNGYCVDGVCCNDACGTNNPDWATDCRACSEALTGRPSGTCSLLAEGAACGIPTERPCDAPDTCSATGTCRENRAANGTPCEDGNFCTHGEKCSAGVCTGSWRRCLFAQKCDENLDLCYPSCGDNIVDTDEDCDDGADNSDERPDHCRTNCVRHHCGDGVRDEDEACDLGGANSDSESNTCRTDCRLPFCGDGVRDSGEGCDQGARNGADSGSTCRADCVPAKCGDGVRDPGEACDDGVLNSRIVPDACRINCAKAWCGDGVIDEGEACDQGAENASGLPDRCRTSCRAPRCGDGVLDSGEECEPVHDGARCSEACSWLQTEPAADASLPAPGDDAGTPSVTPRDAGTPGDQNVDGKDGRTRISAGGCTAMPGADAPWFLFVQLGGLVLLRTAGRAFCAPVRRVGPRRPLLYLTGLLLLGGCLDWSNAPPIDGGREEMRGDAGEPLHDGGSNLDALLDGSRRLVSGTTRGLRPAIGEPKGAVLDRESKRLFVTTGRTNRLLSIDLGTGARRVVSGTDEGGATVGSGPPLTYPSGVVFTAEPGSLYVANGDLFRIDVVTGDRTPISMLSTGLGTTTKKDLKLGGVAGIALDCEAGFIYTPDWSIGRYELGTGNRSVVSQAYY